MKSLINIVLAILLAPAAFAQDTPVIALRTFVKEDTVLLRWAPSTPELLIKGLKNGYRIDRISGSSCSDSGPLDATFLIPSFAENKAQFENSTDENIQQILAFVNELATSSDLSDETKKMAFSILLLSAAANKELAKMIGVYYEDEHGCTRDYQYRVTIQNSADISNYVSLNSGEISQNPDFTTLIGSTRPKLRQAYLSWEAKSLQEGYSAYWIERSTDSIHFERRNKVPFLFLRSKDEPNKVNCDFVDSNVVEGGTYYYRITGISHFAETGKTSNIVKLYVPKSLYGECRMDTIVSKGFVREISGHYHHYAPETPAKFVLLRSDSIQYGYTYLSEKKNVDGKFNFSATVPIESGDRYYYKVAAVSVDNDTVYSFPYYFFTLDQIPPAMPQNLAGVVNDSGIVSLTWTANPDNDIRGYRIFRSNDLKEEFTEVTTDYCISHTFSDTLRLDNLTSTVYYRMVAVDLNFNNSETSPPVLLLKPDTIPPVEAVFRDYSVSAAGVGLEWINSTSVDLSKSFLLRSFESHGDTLVHWNDTTGQFLDTTVVSGQSYHYTITAVDLSGNQSTCQLIINYETGIRQGVSDLQSSVSRAEKSISLSWTLPGDDLYSIQIYRAKNDEAFRLVKTIRDTSLTSFIDKDLSINNTYHYKVKLVYKNGVSSALSEGIVVTY